MLLGARLALLTNAQYRVVRADLRFYVPQTASLEEFFGHLRCALVQ